MVALVPFVVFLVVLVLVFAPQEAAIVLGILLILFLVGQRLRYRRQDG